MLLEKYNPVNGPCPPIFPLEEIIADAIIKHKKNLLIKV